MRLTDQQRDVAQAALLGDERAAVAWRRARAAGIELEALEPGVFPLLPRLWLNREAAVVEQRDRPLLKGIYRQVLARNTVALGSALEALDTLDRAGTSSVLLLGGAALARAEARLGATLLDGVDVLADGAGAHVALEAAGWRIAPSSRRARATLTATTLVAADATTLRLHRHAFWTPGQDAVVHAGAEPAELLGHPVAVPGVTESVLQTCVQGARAPGPSLRWLCDLAILLEHDVAWAALVARAREREVTVAAAAALTTAGRLGLAVPDGVARELAGLPAARRERLAQRALDAPRPLSGLAALAEFRRRRGRHPPAPARTR